MKFLLIDNYTLRNVTLGGFKMLKIKKYPCPLCFDPLDKRISKKNKPYCVCNSCGIQFFIRGKEGIKRFEKLLNSQENQFIATANGIGTGKSMEALSILNKINILKQKLQEVQEKKGLIFVDKDIQKAEEIINMEIKLLRSSLSKILR